METKHGRRRTDRLTQECPIVSDPAVDAAALMVFNHETEDYIEKHNKAAMLRTTLELIAVPDLSLCA